MKYSYIAKIFFLLLLALILLNFNFMCFAENEVCNQIENNVVISNNINSINCTNDSENIVVDKKQEETKENEVKETEEINSNLLEKNFIPEGNVIPENTINTLKKENSIYEVVNFYINYESVALDTEGNITGRDVNLFTPSLYESYVGNANRRTPDIADVSKDNSYTANKKIRALEGYKNREVYIQKIPTDDEIFKKLKQYAQNIFVDGKAVSVDDLNSNNYDIRWYVFKIQDNGWHVDGRLIRKKAILPKTGGNGNYFLYVLGISTIILAGRTFFKIKKEVFNEIY